MNNVLREAADRLARPTGLIQHQGKVTGAKFAQMVALGWIADPKASLETLAQHAAEVRLEERFNTRAVVFLQALFEVALAPVVVADLLTIPLLNRFAAICLEDSSTIR
jgi:hypothetical protein